MTTKRLAQIDKRIDEIKKEIVLIGNMRPGSLTKQYKDSENKTGAYYQISYTHERRSRTEYVRQEHVKEVGKQVDNYKRYKELTTEWVSLSIERSKLEMKLANS